MKRAFIFIILILIVMWPLFLLSNHLVNRPILTSQSNDDVNPDQKIPVLMFHHIDTDISKEYESTVVTPEEFKETLRAIKDNGYTSISLNELDAIYNKKEIKIKNPIVITFDDGYESNYKYAFPILKENKMKANIFIVTSTVGKKPGQFPHFTWEQAKEMEDSGFIEIHNHTYSHKTAAESSEAEFLESVRQAQKDIEKNLGKRRIKAFAYPQGKYNEKLIARLKEEGFSLQFTVEEGQNTLRDKPEKLKRINVSHNEGGKNIIKLINSLE